MCSLPKNDINIFCFLRTYCFMARGLGASHTPNTDLFKVDLQIELVRYTIT